MLNYDAKIKSEIDSNEEIDNEEPQDFNLSELKTLFIVDVISQNFEKESGTFYFIKKLPFTTKEESQLKSLCGSFASWAHTERWPNIKALTVRNASKGLCNDMKVRIWDSSPSYGWNPNDGTHSYEYTLTDYNYLTPTIYQPGFVAGPMAVCNSPRKEKNRWNISYILTY